MNTDKHEEIKDFFTQFNTVYFKERDIQNFVFFRQGYFCFWNN